MFFLVKAMNAAKKAEPPPAPPAPPKEEVLLGEIRDLLKARG
jgi:large conductance mechanosensitive channel